jgi:hypothetical protein
VGQVRTSMWLNKQAIAAEVKRLMDNSERSK